MNELFEAIGISLEIAKDVSGIIKNLSDIVMRKVEETTNSERELYDSRVKARKRAGEYRPEWELIGRIVFDENGDEVVTEMDQVPGRLHNTMKASVITSRLSPISEPLEVTEGTDSYLLEVAGFPRKYPVIFAFFWKPTD